MIGFVIVVAVVLVLFGATVGFVAVVALAGRLDKDVRVPPPSRLARAGRAASGLHRRPEPLREAAAYRHDLPRPGDRQWPRPGERERW